MYYKTDSRARRGGFAVEITGCPDFREGTGEFRAE